MTPQQRHHEHLTRKRGGRSRLQRPIDTHWKAYHRYVFRICAEHLSPSDDLVQFALTVSEPEELHTLIARILEQKELLRLPPDAVSELEAPHASPRRLRQICYRIGRNNETIHPIVVDLIADLVYQVDRNDHADNKDDIDAKESSAGAESVPPFPPFPPIVEEIARIFTLSPLDIRILMALYTLEDIEPMAGLMHQATHRTQMSIIADAADTDVPAFVRETAPGSPLERLGLIAFRGGRDEIFDINVSRPLLFALRSDTLDDLTAGLFDDTPSPRFPLDEFPLPADEIRTCAAAVRGVYPLLIAGEPGIGKTEFARALIHSLGLTGHTLAAQNRRSEYSHGPRRAEAEGSRFNAIRMAANLLSPATDVLIIDEADSILQSAAAFFGLLGGGLDGGSYDKGVLNDLLEHLPVATVWITNDHRMIPTSAMRRFGHVLAFPRPAIDTRVRMLTERLSPLVHDPAGIAPLLHDIAARYDITPAAIDRTARIIAAELNTGHLSPADVHRRVSGYIDRISTGALARDVRRLPTVARSFDPRFCSTSESLDRVERQASHRAQAGQGLRLLFGGPPGGGKTQYALWLAKRLGRDVLLKRPSDLLSKYVGESEEQIAAAFRTAARAGSVLIIDEADALLYDRSIAHRSWEHSQIAEFLQ